MARAGLSKNQVEQITRREVQTLQYSYSGPLPHPEIMEHYEKIVPGGADRIFVQFESQSAHRQKLEMKVINSNTFSQVFGSFSAFVFGLIALSGGLFIAHEGKSLVGFGAFFLGLSSLVGVYVYGKKSQSAERKSKQVL